MLWRAAVVLLVVPILRVHMSVREGYELYAGLGYYKFFPDWGNIKGLSWSEAHDVCHNDGGHLPIINSQAEFDLLYSIFKEEVAIPAFSPLGFHDFFLDGHFVTIYGQSLSETGYMVWGPPCDDPHKCGNDTSKAHCGVMSRFSPGLYVHRCDQLFGFFCEKELWYDYEYYPNVGHYKLNKEGRTWGEAWKVCRSEGAELAVINSAEEYTTLQDILARNPSFTAAEDDSRVHMGFHNKFNSSVFHTTKGDVLNTSGFFLWAKNEPATSRGNCGGLVRNNTLFIGNCAAKLAFICEHRL